MHADAVDDDKLKLLAFEDRWHFVAICCLKAAGVLDRTKNLERRVAIKLGLGPTDCAEVKRRLIEADLISKSWQPLNWAKRQYVSDVSTERVRNYRKSNKPGNVPVTFLKRPETVTETASESESESDSDTEKIDPPLPPLRGDRLRAPVKKSPAKKRKTPKPADFSLSDDRRAYAEEGLPDVDPAALFDKFCRQADLKAWTYTDWHKAWQEYVRNCAPNSGHWAAGQYPRKVRSLAW